MVSCGISTSFPVLFPTERKVAHALLTRPPLKQLIASYSLSPLDLHVLGTPPAFVLSQDQTLALNPVLTPEVSFRFKTHFELTVSLNMTSENHVRVLLDSVSFSRIIRQRFELLSR